MDDGVNFQVLFNVAVAVVGGLGGWLLNAIWNEIRTLQLNERATTAELSSIRVLVAGDYVKKEEFTKTMEKVIDKLDKIHAEVNGKADR